MCFRVHFRHWQHWFEILIFIAKLEKQNRIVSENKELNGELAMKMPATKYNQQTYFHSIIGLS